MDQWEHRNILRGQKAYIAAKWDKSAAHMHPLQGRGFAVVGLDKSSSLSALRVAFLSDNHPILHGYVLL